MTSTYELLTIDAASVKYGVSAETIRQFVLRDRLGDPTGDANHVHDDGALVRLVEKIKAGQRLQKGTP